MRACGGRGGHGGAKKKFRVGCGREGCECEGCCRIYWTKGSCSQAPIGVEEGLLAGKRCPFSFRLALQNHEFSSRPPFFCLLQSYNLHSPPPLGPFDDFLGFSPLSFFFRQTVYLFTNNSRCLTRLVETTPLMAFGSACVLAICWRRGHHPASTDDGSRRPCLRVALPRFSLLAPRYRQHASSSVPNDVRKKE